MKEDTKIRIRTGDVSFYTTVQEINDGVGDYANFNDVCKSVLGILINLRQTDTIPPRGLGGTWHGIQLQMDIAK